MKSSSPPNINFIEVEEINDENLVVVGEGGGGRGGGGQMMEKEHMFDKVVTPSDVGKLNRLVIPKQHAEKYFPFDSSANEKGLLLNFEDRNGKPWRFRYSYWNSSQSYVMTKGWSRFVKEKKLDAGDIVSFLRGVGELGKDVLFIDWRRRPDALQSSVLVPPSSMIRGHHYLSFPYPLDHPYYLRCSRDHPTIQHQHHHHHQLHMTSTSTSTNTNTSSSSYGMVLNDNHFQYPHQLVRTGAGIGMMMQMQRGGCGGVDGGEEIDEDEPMVFESVPVVQGKKAVGKRLRLFGVNMECPISESSEIILPSTAVTANYPMTGGSASSSSTRPYPVPMSSNKMFNKSKGSLSLDFDV